MIPRLIYGPLAAWCVVLGHATTRNPTFHLQAFELLTGHWCFYPEATERAAEFIRTCLRLDPAQRPTSEELEDHDWLSGALFAYNYHEQ